MRRVIPIVLFVGVAAGLVAQAPRDVELLPPVPAARSGEGAPIEYVLGRPATQVVVEVTDARGRVVRSIAGAPDAGRHRVVWDLRYAGPRPIDGLPAAGGDADQGPTVIPGRYTVRLSVDAMTVESPLIVRGEPAGTGVPVGDLEAQLELGLQIRDRMSQAAQVVVDIRALKRQVADRVPQARSPAVGLAADVVTRRLTQVEQPLLSDAWLVLRRRVEAGDRRPSASDAQESDARSAEQDAAIERVRGVVGNEIAAFNTMLTNGGLKALDLPATLPMPR